VGLTVLVYGGFYVAFLLRGNPHSIAALTHELTLSIFLFMLAGSVPFLAATLLHAGDVDLLGVAPIPTRAVIAMRLLEGTAAGMVQFVPVGFPATLACLQALGVPLSRQVLLLLPAAIMVLLPSFASAVALLTAVRVLGYGRVRSAVALVYLVLGAMVCAVVVAQVTSLRLHEGSSGLLSANPNPTGSLAFLPPWGWLGTSLEAIVRGRLSDYALSMVWAVGTTLVLWAVAMALGSSAWLSGNLSSGGTAPRGARPASHAPGYVLLRRVLRAPLIGVISKEFACVFRDSLLVSQAGMPMILFMVPFVMALTPGFRSLGRGDELFALSILMIVAVEYMQTSILSASSVGLEGRSFWVFLTSPNDVSVLLKGKWLSSWFVTSAVACGMTVLAGLAFSAEVWTVGVLCGALITTGAGLCGIGAGTAAALPRFTFENPAHRVSPAAMIAGFALAVMYLTWSWGLIALAWWLGMQWPQHNATIYGSAAMLVVGTAAAATAVPMRVGASRLRELEWEH